MDDDDASPRAPVGYVVIDALRQSLGVLTAVYSDAETGTIVFGTVMMTRRARRRAVAVPLVGADVDHTRRRLAVRCGRDLVRQAPAVRPAADLAEVDEAVLYAHYDLAFQAPSIGRRLVLRDDRRFGRRIR